MIGGRVGNEVAVNAKPADRRDDRRRALDGACVGEYSARGDSRVQPRRRQLQCRAEKLIAKDQPVRLEVSVGVRHDGPRFVGGPRVRAGHLHDLVADGFARLETGAADPHD